MIPSIEALDEAVARGVVSCRPADDDPAWRIYNYTQKCTYDRAWDPVTMAARGLIFHHDELRALPFGKFFNHNQGEASIPSGPPDSAAVKYDGSLGISYVRDGRIRWATRGSLDSTQARAGEAIWREQHARADAPDGVTLLTEIVAPETRVIVPHGFTGLVLLGVREVVGETDWAQADVEALARDLGMRAAEAVDPDPAALMERAKLEGPTAEGWVLRWGSHRVKVAAYLAVAKALQGLSTERSVCDLWYAGADDIVRAIPEELRGDVERWFATFDRDLTDLHAAAEAAWAEHGHLASDRRALVRALGTDHPAFHLLMSRAGGREGDPRLLVYKRRRNGNPRPVGGGA